MSQGFLIPAAPTVLAWRAATIARVALSRRGWLPTLLGGGTRSELWHFPDIFGSPMQILDRGLEILHSSLEILDGLCLTLDGPCKQFDPFDHRGNRVGHVSTRDHDQAIVPELEVAAEVRSLIGVLSGVAAVFFAFIGFDSISTTAEECKNPQRDLPKAMIFSLVICTILYIALALVLTGMISYEKLNVGDPLAFVFGAEGANIPWEQAKREIEQEREELRRRGEL